VSASMRSILCLIIILISLSLFSCNRAEKTSSGGKGQTTIQIIGSDTMVNLVQAWAEGYAPLHSSLILSIRGGGSGTGIAAFINGSCDIAMASRAMEEKEIQQALEKKIQPKEFIVGLDGLMVIVNPLNPVSRLTLDQVRDMFIGKIKNWQEIGGDDLPIVLLSRESNSGTYLFFKEHVLRRGNKESHEEFSPDALLMPSSQAIVNEIVQNPHAVGYVGIGYLSPKLKAVALAKIAGAAYIAPTIEHVMDGSYPISRPLYFYANGEPRGEIKAFIDFALSAAGQKIVKDTDFVPAKAYEKNN
jgi:phosphate transport system substrate-binding protein